MATPHRPLVLEKDSGRALPRQELKRCSVKYRLASNQPETVLVDLVLTNVTIVIENRDSSTIYKEILLEDFLGAEIFCSSSADACWMEINSFPVTKPDSKKARKLDVDAFLFPTTTAESIMTMVKWRNALHQECERAVRRTFIFEDEASVSDSWRRRYLVLINPVAGLGTGVRDFEEYVLPMFELADISLDVIITEYSGHASTVVKRYDLSLVNGIILSSGDGLFYEVVNALMERGDWETAIKTPLGVIPTGTGNALCASLLHENEEDYSLANAAFQIIRGGIRPIDLATVHAGGQITHMAVLSCWTFISDTDVDSENLRAFGKDTRYIIYSIKNILQRKAYHGRLHYIPFEEDESGLKDYNSSDSQQLGKDVDRSECIPQPSHNTAGTEDTASLGTNKHNEQVAPPEESNAATNSPPVSKSTGTGIPLQFLPPMADSKLPGNWKTIEGDFVLFAVLMVPFVAQGFVAHPDVRLGSGYFTICYATDDMKRSDFLRMLLTSKTGEFVQKSEKVVKIKARAFRVEPLTPIGVITVDGEVIPYGPMQAEIHHNFIRVCSRKHMS